MDGRYTIWYYDLISKELSSELNAKILEQKLKISSNILRKHGIIIRDRYITARSLEDLKKYIDKFNKKENLK